MLRPLIATSASILVLLTAVSAGAQDPAHSFAQRGQLILSADRLVPLIAYDDTTVSGTPQTSTSSTTISLLPNTNSFLSGNNNTVFSGNFYNIPRIAFDYAVIDRLTIGGSIYAAFTPSSSTNSTAANGTVTNTDNGTTTLFGIAPRVGYAVPVSNAFVFWPRGGFSFNTLSFNSPTTTNALGQPSTNSITVNQFALDLEAVFVITPVQHFGILFGPVLDIPLTGKVNASTETNGTTVSTSVSQSELHVGVTVGLVGWL